MIQPAPFATYAVVAATVAGIIARPFGWPEAVWASAGALALVAFGLLPFDRAWAGVLKGGDVYLFLVGMMVLAEVARREGLFDWLAARAVRGSRGSASRLFLLVYAVGTLVTVFLSNDATAVVLTPAVYAAARAAKADPLPYLFVCAMVANAASFVLPISNPANLVVFAHGLPPLGAWLARFGAASSAAVVVTFAVLRWSQRGRLAAPIARDAGPVALSVGGMVSGLGIAGMGLAASASSALGLQLGVPTFAAGLLTGAVVLAVKREAPWPVVRHVAWGVLPLVAGLFVLVAALEDSGAVAAVSAALTGLTARSETAAAWIAGGVVAVTGNVVNNLPAGLLAGAAVQAMGVQALSVKALSAQAMGVHDRVADAILIGIDLGPNLSVTGSLATILWLAAIRREGEAVSAWAFLKLGLVVMPPALVAALAGLYLSP